MTNASGYVVLVRIPEVEVSYDIVQEIATDSGFNLAYVPQQPDKRYAWKKATNLRGGLKIQPPPHKLDEIKAQYGVVPKVKLTTEIISDAAPVLVRHIVRTATIPTDGPKDKRTLADTQLDNSTVCIMEYDVDNQVMKSTSETDLNDDEGWVNGNLKQVITDLHARVHKAVNMADNAEVRNGVREWIIAQAGTLVTSGGAYFLPYRAGLIDKLRSLKTYVELLKQYQVDPTKRNPQIMIIPVNKDNKGDFDLGLDVASNAIETFKGRLQNLADDLAPVIGKKGKSYRSENVSKKTRAAVTTEFFRLKADVECYRNALGDDLAALDLYLTGTTNLIKKANGISTYKAPQSKKEKK